MIYCMNSLELKYCRSGRWWAGFSLDFSESPKGDWDFSDCSKVMLLCCFIPALMWLFVNWWKTLLMWRHFSLSWYVMRQNSGSRGRTGSLFSLYLVQWQKSLKEKKKGVWVWGALAPDYFSFSVQTKVLERWYLQCRWALSTVRNFSIFTIIEKCQTQNIFLEITGTNSCSW